MDSKHHFTIMVVDHEKEDRDLFHDVFLHHERFTLLGCLSSGIEALDEISNKKDIPDVLLVDRHMPFFSGLNLVQALEQLEDGRSIYKFILSATNTISENEPTPHNPHIIYLKKPTSTLEVNALPGIILDYLQERVENLP